MSIIAICHNENLKAQKIYGKYIKDLPQVTELNDTDDIIVEDSTPITSRVKLGTLFDSIKKRIASTWRFTELNNQTIVEYASELNKKKKVECFIKTVTTANTMLADFSTEVNQIIKNGGKIISAIPGTTTNSNNALVYGAVAVQASSNWSEVYVRSNSNSYSGLGGTTTLALLVIYE